MRDCISHEHLVSLAGVLGDATIPSVEHIFDCGRCRRELRRLEALRGEFTGEIPLRGGFVDLVMKGIDDDRVAAARAENAPTSAASPSSSWRIGAAAAMALLVAAAVTMIFTASSISGDPTTNVAGTMSSSNVIVGVLAGIATGAWETLRPRHVDQHEFADHTRR